MDLDVQSRKALRRQARNLRTKGWSYEQIRTKINIPKSTLSNWFRDLPPSPHQSLTAKQLNIRRIQPLGAKANVQLRLERLLQIKDETSIELKAFSADDKANLKAMLAMLYWAEGTKNERSGLVFANTDPDLLELFLTLLRRCYEIDEMRLRARIHLHHYHPISETRKFWSKKLDIPEEQFGKVYVKKRSESKRFRRNFHGICFIVYSDTSLKNRLMFIARELKEVVCGN